MRIGSTKEFNGFSLSFIVMVWTLITRETSTDTWISENFEFTIFFTAGGFEAFMLGERASWSGIANESV